MAAGKKEELLEPSPHIQATRTKATHLSPARVNMKNMNREIIFLSFVNHQDSGVACYVALLCTL